MAHYSHEKLLKNVADSLNMELSDIRRIIENYTEKQVFYLRNGDIVKTKIYSMQYYDFPARIGVHPKTGAPVNIKAKNVVKFKTTKALKDAIS